MAEETYGIQFSTKNSDGDMLNFRGADADEFFAVYNGFLSHEGAEEFVEAFELPGGEVEEKPAPKKRSTRATKSKPEPEEEPEEDEEYDDEDDEEEKKPARRTRRPAAKKTATRSRRAR